MDSRTIIIGNASYTVLDRDEYVNNRSLYNNAPVAIDMKDGTVLPVINKTDTESVGIYPISKNSLIDLVNYPSNDFLPDYSSERVMDLSNCKDMRGIIKMQKCIHDAEREILVNTEHVFVPIIGENDDAEMKGFKQAVINKGIDKDKYAPRLGVNALNDFRLFKGGEITMKKLKHLSKAMDIKVSITFEDANADVPNPMGEPITVCITGEED